MLLQTNLPKLMPECGRLPVHIVCGPQKVWRSTRCPDTFKGRHPASGSKKPPNARECRYLRATRVRYLSEVPELPE